jgi:chitinase
VSGGGEQGGAIFSVYADEGISADAWPKASDLGKWNDLLLAFYLTDGRGAFDTSAVWAGLGNDTKQSIVDDYHAAGKKIRVSVFGATDFPLTRGGDPNAIASELASFVTSNNLDGVDIDYEDSASFNANGDGETFLINLTKALRSALPSPQYTISHAPQSPYFTSAGWYPQGAYVKVDKEVGSMIDFYNIQYYNQGQGMYEDCTSLFTGGGTTIAGTSVTEIINSGIPASKVIVGKPGSAGDASNGVMDPATLGGCISSSSVKPGGVMSWQWKTAKADWIEAANGGL